MHANYDYADRRIRFIASLEANDVDAAFLPLSADLEYLTGLERRLPTFLTAAGEPGIVDKLKEGYEANGKTYKAHIDGYDLTPYLSGAAEKHEREHFFYFSDDGDLVAMRMDNWKIVFMEQRATGTLMLWMNPFTPLRTQKIFNLRTDPYETGDITGNTYCDWILRHEYLFVPAQGMVTEFLESFKEFPPRQAAASFTIGDALKKLQGKGSR